LVKVDGLSSENSVPLGRRYSFGEVMGNSKEGFGSAEIVAEEGECLTGLSAAVVTEDDALGVVPWHIFFVSVSLAYARVVVVVFTI